MGPPLTISNREVKPTCADGTALLRVGEYVDASFKPHSFSGVRLFLCARFFGEALTCPHEGNRAGAMVYPNEGIGAGAVGRG